MSDEATHGLTTLSSPRAAAETAARLEALLAARGIPLLARIDHAEAARAAGLSLRPTLLLVFGDARVGTPLMQSRQTIGIDLPLKALVWEDEAGQCWLSYNQPAYLAERHDIADRTEAVAKMSAGLEALARAATAGD